MTGIRLRDGMSVVAAGSGLVACGIAGTLAWQAGLWGSLTGAALAAIWLCSLRWWSVLRPRDASGPAIAAVPVADAVVPGLLLDAAPTPLVAIGNGTARALNRAARRLFATDDRILPIPAALGDPSATHLRHEHRGWRIDRVAVADGGSVAALIDIEREERAAEARATAELIEILGHELLNGLAPIVSLAESGAAAIERPDVDLDLLREVLGTLARRTEGLQRFVAGYRALARLPPPTRGSVQLRDMARDLSRLFAERWPAVALDVEVDDDAMGWVDRDQVEQAVWALLQNAAEAVATMPRGRIALRIDATGDGLAIDVEDDGPGIAPAGAAHIFRLFHTTKAGGTGIGLSLCRQIALAHGGTLGLVGGRATVFRLVLPGQGPGGATTEA